MLKNVTLICCTLLGASLALGQEFYVGGKNHGFDQKSITHPQESTKLTAPIISNTALKARANACLGELKTRWGFDQKTLTHEQVVCLLGAMAKTDIYENQLFRYIIKNHHDPLSQWWYDWRYALNAYHVDPYKLNYDRAMHVISLLLQNGARADAHGGILVRFLMKIIRDGDTVVFNMVLDHSQNLNQVIAAKDSIGFTALHWAAKYNRPYMARKLVENGANVDALNNYKRTPLHVAAWHGSNSVLILLVDRGANINAIGHEGRTPLWEAAHRNESTSVGLLLRFGADPSLAGRLSHAIAIGTRSVPYVESWFIQKPLRIIDPAHVKSICDTYKTYATPRAFSKSGCPSTEL